uniref:Uncharacterized protein n=1 Tax=Rhizophora mucronata TaxID=61149 RepID=A0A2P2J5F9_RHIMU
MDLSAEVKPTSQSNPFKYTAKSILVSLKPISCHEISQLPSSVQVAGVDISGDHSVPSNGVPVTLGNFIEQLAGKG